MTIKTGEIYKIVIEDCCVEGEFTSKVSKIELEDVEKESVMHNQYGAVFYFDNGIVLTQLNGGINFNLINLQEGAV